MTHSLVVGTARALPVSPLGRSPRVYRYYAPCTVSSRHAMVSSRTRRGSYRRQFKHYHRGFYGRFPSILLHDDTASPTLSYKYTVEGTLCHTNLVPTYSYYILATNHPALFQTNSSFREGCIISGLRYVSGVIGVRCHT